MFSRLGYILRETAANLTRNLTLTIASLLTVVVSLSFVGFVFLIQDAVSNQLFQWKDGVEVSIFMSADASQDQIDAVKRDLDASTLVKSGGVRFVNKEEALKEMKTLFPNTPEIVEITKPEDVPTSFRIKPSSTDPTARGVLRAVG
jgi:cell division transport system permease protein